MTLVGTPDRVIPIDATDNAVLNLGEAMLTNAILRIVSMSKPTLATLMLAKDKVDLPFCSSPWAPYPNRFRIGCPVLIGRVKPSRPRRVSGATLRAW